jgi:hypothetical protein
VTEGDAELVEAFVEGVDGDGQVNAQVTRGGRVDERARGSSGRARCGPGVRAFGIAGRTGATGTGQGSRRENSSAGVSLLPLPNAPVGGEGHRGRSLISAGVDVIEQGEPHTLADSPILNVSGPARHGDAGLGTDAAQRWLTERLSEAPTLAPEQLRRLRQLLGVDDPAVHVRSA